MDSLKLEPYKKTGHVTVAMVTFESAIFKMSSIEHSRTSPYSEDIRWRIVYEREGLGIPASKVANNLHVDISTVKRIVKHFRRFGNVKRAVYPNRLPPKLTSILQFYVLDLVLNNPGIYLREIQAKIEEEYLLHLDCSTLCKFLHKSGFSHQKLQIVPKQRDEMLRAQYCLDVSFYSQQSLIFIDETGCDRRDILRRKGYSIRGKPAKCHRLVVRGVRVSVIAAISVHGLLDLKICRGGVNSDVLCNFIREDLSLHLYPFTGHNPHSVIILDNCNIHHTAESVAELKKYGSLVHFLPPYSPDYNPIENIFAKAKKAIKLLEDYNYNSLLDIDEIILRGFGTITPEDCRNSFIHPCIYNN